MSQIAHEQQLLRQLKDERSTLHDLAWELDEVEAQLGELAGQDDQLDALRARRAQLEEAVLQQMLYIDRLQHSLDQQRFPPIKAA